MIDLLEHKLIQPKKCITELEKKHPVFLYEITVNPYSGCYYNCPFCYALTSQDKKIGIKTNILNKLKQKLNSLIEKKSIMIGSLTEPYQPLEEEFKLTRCCLEIIIEKNFPLQIFTKSSLILRDIDLISEYSKQGLCAVNITLFTLEEPIKNIFEPNALGIETRLKIIHKLHEKNILVGIVFSPILPYINDETSKIEELFKIAKKFCADYIVPGVLVINSEELRQRIFNILRENFPDLVDKYEALYEEGPFPEASYIQKINSEIISIAEKNKMKLHLPVHGFQSFFDIRMEPLT
ncbi:MAG: radical SAM protein [Endomicrobiia bacterium]